MNKTSKIIVTSVIIAILLLGVGYAAIQNITLTIAGTAAADPNQANFKVMFSGTPTVSDENYVAAAITDDINATMSVTGLTKKGDVVSATYTVQNASEYLSADLKISTTNNNTEFFTLSSEIAKTSLIAGEATTVTVPVEVTKTPIKESVHATIGVQIEAMPVQPGEEGTSEGINGSSQTPAANVGTTIGDITNADIGDYIDLGNNIVGTESTSDDWRILYKDGNTVYAILADYLPNSTGYAKAAGLDISKSETEDYVYSVYSKTNTDTLVNGLKNEAAWNGLANGLSGATVIGSPTAELLMSSYNTKNGTELVYTDSPTLDNTTEDYDLYVPHTAEVDGCREYWLASTHAVSSSLVWGVDCYSRILSTRI